MRKYFLAIAVVMLVYSLPSSAGLLDDLMKGGGLTPSSSSSGLSNEQVVSGLKEALHVGTTNAVGSVSKTDGYLGNAAIKILMPEKMQKVADVLGKVGYQKQVDDFVTSMNRAAEKAAPQAKPIFVDALKEMSFEDARKILGGGDTAATDYFKTKTHDRMYDAFKPIVSSRMNEVGVAQSYKAMMGKYSSIPFARTESMDLDHYVTNKALDGIYYMVAQEEKKIRTDPAARVTDLLKTVFGKR